jgi:uncharacterized lipoprotein YddW (UPF0748 family)
MHTGFKSTSQIDALVARAVAGNYNAIVAEVMAFQDSGTSSHGAYWNSAIVPKATDISGSIDPLQYLCQQANAQGIDVHAWLVTYRVSRSFPPANNTFLASHPEYFMVPTGGTDADPFPMVGEDYALDPGSPDVQEYLVSIAKELATNYAIKGINWDYVRYTQRDAGYPARSSYANSSLKRFQRIYNRSDTPSYTDSQWSDFRRRTIDELVRRCRAELAAIDTPRQPIMLTVDALATGSAPSDFSNSAAYIYHQNWKMWLEAGWLDALVPMNYKREHCSSEAAAYRSWIDKIVSWKGARHAYCGQGNYLNSFENSVTQMQYVFSAGAEGACNYSYASTRSTEVVCDDNDTETADWTWYSYLAGSIYAQPATTPTLPWRSPATATEGTVWGQVLSYATGLPIDDATVTVYGRPAVKTDPNGYYTVTLVPGTATGTLYLLTVAKTGYTTISYPGARSMAGGLTRYDFSMGAPAPQIVASTTSLTATMKEGETPASQTFTLAGASGRAPLNYAISSNATWMSVTPAQGTSRGEADTITVSFDQALTAGTYSGTLTISDVAATNTPQTIAVTMEVQTPPAPGDFDLDGDVDCDDFAHLQNCLSGVGVAQTLTTCSDALLDSDDDVDGDDVTIFIGCLSGPDVQANANCYVP